MELQVWKIEKLCSDILSEWYVNSRHSFGPWLFVIWSLPLKSITSEKFMADFCTFALLKALKINFLYSKRIIWSKVQKFTGKFSHGLDLTSLLFVWVVCMNSVVNVLTHKLQAVLIKVFSSSCLSVVKVVISFVVVYLVCLNLKKIDLKQLSELFWKLYNTKKSKICKKSSDNIFNKLQAGQSCGILFQYQLQSPKLSIPFNLHPEKWFWGCHLRFFRAWTWKNIGYQPTRFFEGAGIWFFFLIYLMKPSFF